MRFKNGLSLFQKTNTKWSINLAAWHSPHSITWRWILGWRKPTQKTWWRLGFYPHRTNPGLQWYAFIPLIGELRWHIQEPMWYRDLYLRKERQESKDWPNAYQRGFKDGIRQTDIVKH